MQESEIKLKPVIGLDFGMCLSLLPIVFYSFHFFYSCGLDFFSFHTSSLADLEILWLFLISTEYHLCKACISFTNLSLHF